MARGYGGSVGGLAEDSLDAPSGVPGGGRADITLASNSSITAGGKLPTTCCTSPTAIAVCQVATAAIAAQTKAGFSLRIPRQQHVVLGEAGLGRRVVMARTCKGRPTTMSAVDVTTTAGRTLRKPLLSSNSAPDHTAQLRKPSRRHDFGSCSGSKGLSISSNHSCGGR